MKSIVLFFSILSIAIMLNLLTGCYYDKEQLLYPASTGPVNCSAVSAKFILNVKPIIQSKCATPGCHNQAGSAGGAVLETYTQIAAQSDRIMQRCVVEKSMPTDGALPAAEIAIIKCWIDAGSPNN